MPTFVSRLSLGVIAALTVVAAIARTDAAIYPFATLVFGLAAAPDGSLLTADAGAGVVEIRKGIGTLVAQLRGVTDVAQSTPIRSTSRR